MSKSIPEHVLKSIDLALRTHAVEVYSDFEKIVRSGRWESRKFEPGSSIHGKFSANVSWTDGEPITKALEAIERELGYNAMFGELQINYVAQCWRNFVEPRQLPN